MSIRQSRSLLLEGKRSLNAGLYHQYTFVDSFCSGYFSVLVPFFDNQSNKKKREPEAHFEKDLLLKEFFLLLHELSSSVCWPSSNQVESLQKGGVPAAPSGTATLLRLSPSHQFYPRPLLAVTDFRYPRLPWLDGRCVQGPGTYSPRRG